jgi:hypothetical protein
LLNKELMAAGHGEPNFSSPSRDRADSIMFYLSRISWPLVLGVTAAAAIVIGAYWGYSAWHKAQTTDPLEGLSAGVYQTPSTIEPTLPLPSHR